MKKLVFAAFAAIALTASVSFVSCDGNGSANDSIDSTVVEVEATVDTNEVEVSVDTTVVEAPADSVAA